MGELEDIKFTLMKRETDIREKRIQISQLEEEVIKKHNKYKL